MDREQAWHPNYPLGRVLDGAIEGTPLLRCHHRSRCPGQRLWFTCRGVGRHNPPHVVTGCHPAPGAHVSCHSLPPKPAAANTRDPCCFLRCVRLVSRLWTSCECCTSAKIIAAVVHVHVQEKSKQDVLILNQSPEMQNGCLKRTVWSLPLCILYNNGDR